MRKFILGLLAFSVLLTIGSLIASPYLTAIIMTPALLIMFVVTSPVFFLKKTSFFSPWSFLIYFTFLNVFLRSFCIANVIPDPDIVNAYFFLGKKVEGIIWPSIVVLLAFVAMAIGFMNKPIQISQKKSMGLSVDNWAPNKFNFLMIFILLVSVIAFVKFVSVSIESFLLLSLTNFSNYRGISSDLTEYSSNGYLRWVIQMSDIVMYLCFVKMVQATKRNYLHIFLFVISLLVSVGFYVFVQSRSGVMMLFINIFILSYLFGKRKISFKKIAVIAVICLSFFGLLTSLREGSGFSVEEVNIFYPLKALEPFIVNNGGIDISKTWHIIDYVDAQNDFKFGGTIIWLMIAWIPRQVWPDKPVNIDTVVGMKIYGADTYGTGAVPPGVFAELYWNFWYVGIFLGCWIIGMVIRSVQVYFENRTNDCNSMILYVICFMQLGIAIVGSSVTSAITGILFSFIPLLLIFRFLTSRKQKQYSNVSQLVGA
jgi:oligosaccharide repeat unit polymerase